MSKTKRSKARLAYHDITESLHVTKTRNILVNENCAMHSNFKLVNNILRVYEETRLSIKVNKHERILIVK